MLKSTLKKWIIIILRLYDFIIRELYITEYIPIPLVMRLLAQFINFKIIKYIINFTSFVFTFFIQIKLPLILLAIILII